MTTTIKALTVQQPWAWAIIHGGKDIENRTQLWSHRGPLAIHAGARWSERGGALMAAHAAKGHLRGLPPIGRNVYDYGALIGVVDLIAAHHAEQGCCESPWAEHGYVEHGGRVRRHIVHLELANPRAIQPISVRGALGLWNLPDDAAQELAR